MWHCKEVALRVIKGSVCRSEAHRIHDKLLWRFNINYGISVPPFTLCMWSVPLKSFDAGRINNCDHKIISPFYKDFEMFFM